MKNGALSMRKFEATAANLRTLLSSLVPNDLTESDLDQAAKTITAIEADLAIAKTKCTTQVVRLSEQGHSVNPKQFWLNHKVSKREAELEVAKAKTTTQLADLSKALPKISKSNFDSLARQISRLDTEELNAIDSGAMIEQAKKQPADSFDRILRNHIEAQTVDPLADAKTQRGASTVKSWLDKTSRRGHTHLDLDLVRHEEVTNRIQRQMTQLANQQKDTGTSNIKKDPKLAAEALYQLVCGSPRHSISPSDTHRKAPAADLIVVVDETTLRTGPHKKSVMQTETGTQLAAETVSRLACDATIRKVKVDSAGIAIDVGRKSRTATDAQWAATKAMYSACAWDGCEQPIGWCQLHHIQYWRNGGKTNMNNLVPLCNHHHHEVHEGGWTLKLGKNRALEHYKPDKSLWKTTKPPNRLDTS